MGESIEKKITNLALALLISVSIALSGWTLSQVHTLAIRVNTLVQKVDDGKEARLGAQAENKADHARIERILEGLVPRREFEAKLAVIEAQLKDISRDVEVLKTKLNGKL